MYYVQSLVCLLKKKRFATAMATRDGGGGVLIICESFSLGKVGCRNCRGEFASLFNARTAVDLLEVERFPGERASEVEESAKREGGPSPSRPGGGRHSTSNQLSLRLFDALA
jgi:hypothetical protein